MNLSADSVPSRVLGVEWCRLDEQVVLLDAEGKLLRGLNHVGGVVWETMDGRLTAGEIAARIADSFGERRERILADVLAFLESLSERSLLSVARKSARERVGAP